jgi:hypothetical protein
MTSTGAFRSNRSALVLGAAPKNEDTKLCTSMVPTRRDCSSSSRASRSRPLRARTDTCRDVLARALRQRPLAALRQDPRRPSGHGLRRVLQGSVVVEAGHLFGRRAVRSIKMDYMPSTWRSRSCPIFRGGVQPPQQTPRPPAQGPQAQRLRGHARLKDMRACTRPAERPLAALRQDPRRPSGHGPRVLRDSVVVEAGHLFTFDLRRAAGGGWCALNSSTTSAAMR